MSAIRTTPPRWAGPPPRTPWLPTYPLTRTSLTGCLAYAVGLARQIRSSR